MTTGWQECPVVHKKCCVVQGRVHRNTQIVCRCGFVCVNGDVEEVLHGLEKANGRWYGLGKALRGSTRWENF